MAYKLLSTMTKWNTLFTAKNNFILMQNINRNMSSSSNGAGANVGFIGLGNMGKHMATNLLNKVRFVEEQKKLLYAHALFILLIFIAFQIQSKQIVFV